MRVGFLLEQCLSPVPGGTGRYSRELAAALAASAAEGSSVRGWTAWHRDVAAAVVPGVGGPTRLPLERRALGAAWERGVGPAPRDAELVHAPTLLMPPRRRRALVVTIHDAVPWTHPETLTARGVGFHRRMAARAAREADIVIVPTAAVRAQLAGFVELADRVRVVPEGVAASLVVPPDAAERRSRLGVPGEYLVAVGTLEPRKGIDVLLEALALPDAPKLPLVLVGQPGWGGVVTPAHSLALGQLGDADLAAVVAGAVALVTPSRAEGFGLPVLEAMSLGVPVVTSDAPALVEVGGGATRVVPVGDAAALAEALAQVAADTKLRTRLVAAGRKRAADFTWPAAAAATWHAYAEALA